MPLPPMKDFRCCNQHLDYPTPVIGTMKFDQYEFWCPHCGAKYQLFDGFKYYPKNLKLELRFRFFAHMSVKFLSNKEDSYGYQQRPDSIFVTMSDADIALAMFNLGFRYKTEHLIAGTVLYTLNHKKITIVEHDDFLFFENEEATQHKPICELKNYDIALLPDVDTIAQFFIKSMAI